VSRSVPVVLFVLGFVLPMSVFSFPDPLQGDGAGTRVDPYLIPQTSAEITVDGVPDEAVWQDALVLDLPYEVTPGENVPAPVKTEVSLMYSESHLYVAFRCHDPDPRAIRAFLRDRDSGWNDDRAVLVLDTFNDERRSIVFGVNALGVQTDYYENSAGESDIGWDTIWGSATRIAESSWTVEMAIPFRSISFQRSEGPQIWGIVLTRLYPRSLRTWLANSPDDRNNGCSLCQAAKFIGFEGAAPGRNIEITPTVTAVRTDARTAMPDGDLEKANEETEAGLTFRWGFTPNLTLTATGNPDFSQVEADALQLDINEPFALFYEERRPFFTEGIDFFDTELDAVYTRTMRDPDWGAKVTGKEGRHTVGAYVVRDHLTNLVFPGSQSSGRTTLDVESTASVLRYKQDVGDRYTVGILGTNRETDDYFNYVAGVDGDVRVTDSDRVKVQVLGSRTRYPWDVANEFGQGTDRLESWAMKAAYRHASRNFYWWVNYDDRGRDFRADLGFIPQVDYQHADVGFSHVWRAGAGHWYSSCELSGSVEEARDQDGNLLIRIAHGAMAYSGPMQSFIYLDGMRTREMFAEEEFDQDRLYWITSFRPSGGLYLGLEGYAGDRIDYSNIRPGERIRLSPEIQWNIGRRVRLDLAHNYERLEVDGGELYTAQTSQLVAYCHFTARSFARAVLQYVNYDRNTDLYTFDIDSKSEHVFSQFLFSYKINPRTVLFLGYSDNHMGTELYGLTQADRTVFAKIGYGWRL